MSKNQKQLQKGEARIGIKDGTAMSVVIDARTGQVTGSSAPLQRASGSGPRQNYYEYDPPPGTETLDHYRFFEKRIDVNMIPSPLSEVHGDSDKDFTRFGDPSLAVLVEGDAVFDADLLKGVEHRQPLQKWKNEDPTSSFFLEQKEESLAPLYYNRGFLRFNGTTHYMEVSYSDYFPLLGDGTRDWTVSCVLRIDPELLGKQTVISQGASVSISVEGDQIILDIGEDNGLTPFQLTAPIPVADEELVILHVVRQGFEFLIYVNGVLGNVHIDSENPLRRVEGATNYIGRDGDESNYLASDLYYLGIERRGLSPVEVMEQTAALRASHSDGLMWWPQHDSKVVAWWDATRFVRDPDEIREWPDLLSDGLHVASPNSPGTSNQRPTYEVEGINGRPSVHLENSRSHFEVNTISDALSGSRGYTITFLVQPKNLNASAKQAIGAFNTSSGGNVTLLFLMSGGTIDLYDNESGIHYESKSTFQNDDILVLTWMLNGVTGLNELYINDILEISYYSNERPEEGGRFSIGQEWDTNTLSDFFKGYLGVILVGEGYSQELRGRFEALAVYTYFVPEDLPGYLSRYKAASLDLEDLDPVSFWEDAGPGERDAGQVDITKQPIYEKEEGSVLFGAGSYLEIPKAFGNEPQDELSVIALAQGEGTLIGNEAWTFGYDEEVPAIYYTQGAERLEATEGVSVLNIASMVRRGAEVGIGRNHRYGRYTKTFSSLNPDQTDKTRIGQTFEGRLYDLALYDRALRSYEIRAAARHMRQDSERTDELRPDIPQVQYEFDALLLEGLGYAHNDLIPAMEDMSGNGNDALQGDPARQARYLQRGLGGKPSLYFDGQDDSYLSQLIPATGSEPRAIYCVLGPQTSGSGNRAVFSWGSQNSGRLFCLRSSQGNTYSYYFRGNNNSYNSVMASTKGQPEIICLSYDGDTLKFWSDGILVFSWGIDLNTTSEYPLSIGTELSPTEGQHYMGYLSYMMISSHAPTQEEVEDMTAWLAQKYDIVL